MSKMVDITGRKRGSLTPVYTPQDEFAELRKHVFNLTEQVKELTQRLNCLSDKVTDQSTLIEKLVD